MNIYIYIYTHTRTHTHTHICAHTLTHYVYARNTRTRNTTYAFTHTRTHAHTYTHTRTHVGYARHVPLRNGTVERRCAPEHVVQVGYARHVPLRNGPNCLNIMRDIMWHYCSIMLTHFRSITNQFTNILQVHSIDSDRWARISIGTPAINGFHYFKKVDQTLASS